MPKKSERGEHRLSIRLTDEHWRWWNKLKFKLTEKMIPIEPFVIQTLQDRAKKEKLVSGE